MVLEKPQLKYAVAKTNSRAKDYNDNFNKLLDYVDAAVETVVDKADKSYVDEKNAEIETRMANLLPIGQPAFSLSGVLPDGCIWLEGAEVSRTTYASLFAVYGTTYGEGDGSTTFNLPNFTDRTIWGASENGYQEAELPDITGSFSAANYWPTPSAGGALYIASTWDANLAGNGGTRAKGINLGFAASRSSTIYKSGGKNIPASVRVRVYTRYE